MDTIWHEIALEAGDTFFNPKMSLDLEAAAKGLYLADK